MLQTLPWLWRREKDIWTHSSWSSSQSGPGLSSRWLSTASCSSWCSSNHHLFSLQLGWSSWSARVRQSPMVSATDRSDCESGSESSLLQYLRTTPPSHHHHHKQIYLENIISHSLNQGSQGQSLWSWLPWFRGHILCSKKKNRADKEKINFLFEDWLCFQSASSADGVNLRTRTSSVRHPATNSSCKKLAIHLIGWYLCLPQ